MFFGNNNSCSPCGRCGGSEILPVAIAALIIFSCTQGSSCNCDRCRPAPGTRPGCNCR